MSRVAKSKKKVISVCCDDVSPYELEGMLANVRDQIQSWIEKYGPTASLSWDGYHREPYSTEPSPRFEIKINREEIDEEFDKRIEREALQQSQQEARELAELERLQTKFGAKK